MFLGEEVGGWCFVLMLGVGLWWGVGGDEFWGMGDGDLGIGVGKGWVETGLVFGA